MSHGQRAAKKLRLYVKANRHNHLWTATYRNAPASRGDVTHDIRRFQEALRRAIGRVPVALVPERGERNGRWHIHFTLDRRVPIALVERCWNRGYVFVRGPSKKKKSWKTATLSKYLAKYVGKEVADGDPGEASDRAQGEHRYYVAQGFAPTAWSLVYGRLGQAYERMVGLYGQEEFSGTFGDWDAGTVFGLWYRFGEHLWHPPPRYRGRDLT